jgi:hypothetical protein
LYEGLLALIDYLDVYNSLCNAHSWIIWTIRRFLEGD